ncbi:MAG: hypothetical protein ACRBN8_40770 [Nannocystales bacterium]
MFASLLTLALAAPLADVRSFELATVHTSTAHVEDLGTDGKLVWAATRGGLEVYDVATGALQRRFDTRHGLDTAHVWSVELADGVPTSGRPPAPADSK